MVGGEEPEEEDGSFEETESYEFGEEVMGGMGGWMRRRRRMCNL